MYSNRRGPWGTAHILLLTGPPGVGKTSALRRVAAGLHGRRISGFYTEELREGGERQGFRAITFDGQQATMAHLKIAGRLRVSRYGVDVAVVDALADSTLGLDRGAEIYLVDEIGKMECLSRRFVAAMRALLDTPRLIVATVAVRGSGLIAEVKRRSDAECWSLTRANRGDIPPRALAWLAARQKEAGQQGC